SGFSADCALFPPGIGPVSDLQLRDQEPGLPSEDTEQSHIQIRRRPFVFSLSDPLPALQGVAGSQRVAIRAIWRRDRGVVSPRRDCEATRRKTAAAVAPELRIES